MKTFPVLKVQMCVADSALQLMALVNEQLELGWELHGSMCTGDDSFWYQPMVATEAQGPLCRSCLLRGIIKRWKPSEKECTACAAVPEGQV